MCFVVVEKCYVWLLYAGSTTEESLYRKSEAKRRKIRLNLLGSNEAATVVVAAALSERPRGVALVKKGAPGIHAGKRVRVGFIVTVPLDGRKRGRCFIQVEDKEFVREFVALKTCPSTLPCNQ